MFSATRCLWYERRCFWQIVAINKLDASLSFIAVRVGENNEKKENTMLDLLPDLFDQYSEQLNLANKTFVDYGKKTLFMVR